MALLQGEGEWITRVEAGIGRFLIRVLVKVLVSFFV